MTPWRILEDLSRAGGELTFVGGKLRWRGVPDRLRGPLRENAEAIRAALVRTDPERWPERPPGLRGEPLARAIAELHGLDMTAWLRWIGPDMAELHAVAHRPEGLSALLAAFRADEAIHAAPPTAPCADCANFHPYPWHPRLGRCAVETIAGGVVGLWGDTARDCGRFLRNGRAVRDPFEG